MSETNRRHFLQHTGAGVLSAAATVPFASAKAAGPNERIRVALMGCGGRGPHVASVFDARDDAEIAYVVDPHKHRLAKAARQFGKAKTTDDIRRALDDKSIDAVLVATPVHWHAPGTIMACQAGKNVYVEKPCSHNLREGRLMVDAARHNKCVVQHGTQVRSTSTIREGVRLLHQGAIGDVVVARAWNIQKREGTGRGKAGTPPAELDYNLWLGPVPEVPFHSTTFSGWNWLRHFGTGEIGNDGIHDIEYARWGLGVDNHPTAVSGTGGRYVYNNGAEFPDTQQISFEYPVAGKPDQKRVLIYEERLWSTNYPYNCDSGVEFYGTKGQMFLSRRGKIQLLSDRNRPRKVDVPKVAQDTPAHVADFLDAIRKNRRPNADIEIGHLTTSLCHLGNLAIRLGRSLRFDPRQEQIVDDKEANALLERTYRDGHWAAPKP